MDQSEVPILKALADYYAIGRAGFTPPGHRQGRGADAAALDVSGESTVRSDVLLTAGLVDRSSSRGYLARAGELMADAVGGRAGVLLHCGSSFVGEGGEARGGGRAR
jgi:lysine decarboxylase